MAEQLGERLYTRLDVRPYLVGHTSLAETPSSLLTFQEASVVDVLQPDLAHAGGISEVRRIAAMAE